MANLSHFPPKMLFTFIQTQVLMVSHIDNKIFDSLKFTHAHYQLRFILIYLCLGRSRMFLSPLCTWTFPSYRTLTRSWFNISALSFKNTSVNYPVIVSSFYSLHPVLYTVELLQSKKEKCYTFMPALFVIVLYCRATKSSPCL